MAKLKIDGYIKRLVFKSGLELSPRTGDILVIIGPNNSGKSATLRDIRGILGENIKGVVVSEVELERLTPMEEIEAALRPFVGQHDQVQLPGFSLSLGAIASWWRGSASFVGAFFVSRLISDLSTRVRLGDCDPAPPFDARNPHAASHPFQYFYQDDALEERASKLFRRAFKMDFVIHRAASGSIPAYVGERPRLKRKEDRISRTYLDRLESLDKLEEQGDGMRSFASVMGRVLAEDRPIILIDEPEAFLHPPQASLLADIIGSEAVRRQIIIATHSSDVLQGLMNKHASRVSVIRLSRLADIGKAVQLDSGQTSELWKDAILRFSNVLDGLFHDGVVITEADADCRFYEAVTAATVVEDKLPDVHYTYSGGKDRLPVVIRSLKRLGVPVVTIADFDLLNSEKPLLQIVDAHGGDWSKLKSDWELVKASVEQGGGFVSAKEFKAEMAKILGQIAASGAVDKDKLSAVKKLARNASPWDHVKHSGLAAIRSGDATRAAKRLLSNLQAMGVFVTPNGEMEGFCRSVGNHGPRWVEDVLKRDLAGDPELTDVRTFVEQYVAFLNSALALN